MVVAEKKDEREWSVIESGGQKIFGILHRPLCEKPAPCVVIMHGFASSKHGSNRTHVLLSEMLAEKGIASFRFDFRGSGDSEGSIYNLSLEDFISDALSALNHVTDLPGIDRERIGVYGSSLGGSIASLCLPQFGKARCMVLWAPVASGELWYRDFIQANPQKAQEAPEKVMTHYRGFAISPAFQKQFAKMAAAESVRMLDIPFLHMQGESDQIVSILHQEVYRDSYGDKLSPSRFLSYPDSDHRLGEQKVSNEVIEESSRWFQEHL